MMVNELPVAETTPAISWPCTVCNRLNYTQFEASDVTEREMLFRVLHQISPDDPLPDAWLDFNKNATVTNMPQVVTCISCKQKHIPHNIAELSHE